MVSKEKVKFKKMINPNGVPITNCFFEDNPENILATMVEDEPEGFSCPENSSGDLVCVCDIGFEGNLTFDQDEGWSGTCVVSNATDNETDNETENNSTESDLTEEELEEIAEDGSLPAPSFVAVLILVLLISIIRRKE